MQSPLKPQRGRIESNPGEYTHMERPARGELAVMPLGSRCALDARRHIRAISRTLRCNLQQSRYNSPMRIAHDDDIGARDWGRIHGRATDNAGD